MKTTTWSSNSRRTLPTQRPATPFCHGLRKAVLVGWVPEDRRAAYHAGAVLCAGAVVALASAGVEAFGAAGISERDAVAALLPLMRSAIRGIERRGLHGGLTGPVVRGDVEVIRAHLAALPPGIASLYRALSRRSLALAADRLVPDVRARIEELLRD